MIKNIIFDFGNVLLGWNEDEIVRNYAKNQIIHIIYMMKELFYQKNMLVVIWQQDVYWKQAMDIT